MSRSNLQKEKFVSTRVAAGKRAGTSEKMKPSISNSFIKKQSAQIKTMSQGKGHNFTMGNNHDSKKVNEIRGKMESSVALPKIGNSSSKPNRGNSRIVRRTISSKEGRSQPCRNSQWKVSHTKNKQDSSTRNDATQILDRDINNFSDDEPYSRTIKDGKIEYNNQIRNDKSKITPKLAKISKVISSSQKRTREGEMSPGNQKIAPLMNHSSAYKRRSTHSSQAKKTSDTKEVESNKAKEKDLMSKTSNPDNILNSIIQSRCLTKDQQRAAVENDKMSPCKENKLRNLMSKDDYGDANAQQKFSRKGSRVRKSVSSHNKRREDRPTRKEDHGKEERKDPKIDEEIDKPWISYLRNLRIPMMCQLHRKITVAISENSLKATPPQTKKNDKSPVSMKKRNMNRNPNCNHNSNIASFTNTKTEHSRADNSYQNKDLLWKNGKNYSEQSELNSLKGLLIRLFFDNSLGEDVGKGKKSRSNASYVLRNDINRMYSEFEEFYSNDDILIDGNIVNKYSLWIIKNLNPHHKAYVYALMKCGKVHNRELALMAINNCMNWNNQWEKDCYYCVLTYMLVQTIKSEFKIGSKDLIKCIKKLMDYPIQPLKRTSIMNLFPTKAELEQQAQQEEQKTTPVQKPNIIKKTIKYKSDKVKSISKNRFIINELKPNKDSIFEQKENAYRKFVENQQRINGMEINPVGSCKYLKYALGRGNNSLLVQLALKSRWWWQRTKRSNPNVNFLWTQLMCRKFISNLKRLNRGDHGSESELDTTNFGSTSNTILKESGSTSDTKNTTSSSLTTSGNNFPSQKLSKVSNSVIHGRRRKAIKKDPLVCDKFKICNHLENHFHLSNKKALYYNMKAYFECLGKEPFNYIPLTYHIQEGSSDPQFELFSQKFEEIEAEGKGKKSQNIWIVKPGENTNRGNGITVCRDMSQIISLVDSNVKLNNGKRRSYIVQKYMENPLLINRRKFDIRCYSLVTSINGNICGYWYKDGYIRTACKEFSLKNVSNKYIHLTNDAIQKYSNSYGKYEDGNKLSYKEFQKHFEVNCPDMKIDFDKIYPQMKKLATDTIKATYMQIDPNNNQYTFELFGYDFMVDENQKVWLIEVNTNPCLELSSSLLSRMIPALVENVVKVAIDPVFPAPEWSNSRKGQIPDFSENKFELVFNESKDGDELKEILKQANLKDIIREEDEQESGNEDDSDEENVDEEEEEEE